MKVPKISFLLPFGDNSGSQSQLRSLYNDIYKDGVYQQLWYYLDDKPMLMAYSDSMPSEIRNFFTFRSGQAAYLLNGKTNVGQWGMAAYLPAAGLLRHQGTAAQQDARRDHGRRCREP